MVLLAHPGEGWGQDSSSASSLDPIISTGEGHREAGRPDLALAIWEAALVAEPGRYAVLWRAARESVVLGMLQEEEDRQNEWFVRGEEFAGSAIGVDSAGVEGRYWLLAARGRRALQSGIVTTARLAREIHAGAALLLAEVPHHAGAHHVMGVLNSEVMKLPSVTRFLGRRLLGGGTDLYETSWEEAERHLMTAVELDPGMLLYQMDLALMYIRREKVPEAQETLRMLIGSPPREAVDPHLKSRARALLQELDNV
jgi:tetratricopeptide (TPR) repeat protein